MARRQHAHIASLFNLVRRNSLRLAEPGGFQNTQRTCGGIRSFSMPSGSAKYFPTQTIASPAFARIDLKNQLRMADFISASDGHPDGCWKTPDPGPTACGGIGKSPRAESAPRFARTVGNGRNSLQPLPTPGNPSNRCQRLLPTPVRGLQPSHIPRSPGFSSFLLVALSSGRH